MDETAVLNSWKEISKYLGRGVRTVQRWERDFGLPVRRPAGHMKSAVVALRSDIDQWLMSREMRESNKELAARPVSPLVLSRSEYLLEQIELLEKQLEALRAEFARCTDSRTSRVIQQPSREPSVSWTVA